MFKNASKHLHGKGVKRGHLKQIFTEKILQGLLQTIKGSWIFGNTFLILVLSHDKEVMMQKKFLCNIILIFTAILQKTANENIKDLWFKKDIKRSRMIVCL